MIDCDWFWSNYSYLLKCNYWNTVIVLVVVRSLTLHNFRVSALRPGLFVLEFVYYMQSSDLEEFMTWIYLVIWHWSVLMIFSSQISWRPIQTNSPKILPTLRVIYLIVQPLKTNICLRSLCSSLQGSPAVEDKQSLRVLFQRLFHVQNQWLQDNWRWCAI